MFNKTDWFSVEEHQKRAILSEMGVSEFLCKRFGLQLTEMRSPN